MERYRVLLVDDEEEIRAGISRKIDWDSLGFTLAGEADNGEEALELARRRLIFEELFCLACGMALLRTPVSYTHLRAHET